MVFPFIEKDKSYVFEYALQIENSAGKIYPYTVERAICTATSTGLIPEEYFDFDYSPSKTLVKVDEDGFLSIDKDIRKFLKKDYEISDLAGSIIGGHSNWSGDSSYITWYSCSNGGSFWCNGKPCGNYDDIFDKLLSNKVNLYSVIDKANRKKLKEFNTWGIDAKLYFRVNGEKYSVQCDCPKPDEDVSTAIFKNTEEWIENNIKGTKDDITVVLPSSKGTNPFIGKKFKEEGENYSLTYDFKDGNNLEYKNIWNSNGETKTDTYTYTYAYDTEKKKLMLKREKFWCGMESIDDFVGTYEEAVECAEEYAASEFSDAEKDQWFELMVPGIRNIFNSIDYYSYELDGENLKLTRVLPDSIEEYLMSSKLYCEICTEDYECCMGYFDEGLIGSIRCNEWYGCPLEVKNGIIYCYGAIESEWESEDYYRIPYEYDSVTNEITVTIRGSEYVLKYEGDFDEYNMNLVTE